MTKTSKTIVFFGSGPVAAESLRLLVQDFTVEAVVTKPRPAHHKGDVPVLRVAEELGLAIHTVSNKATLDELIATDPFQSEVGILIDFGIIVSQNVIDYFPYGIVNSHFSILPEWRGADPITFAILSGQKQTGVSLMLLVEAMDEGPLIGYGEYDLSSDITTPALTTDLIGLSHTLLKELVPAYIERKQSVPQTVTGREVSYSRKLTKSDGDIEWQKPAQQIEREIRAYSEWPKSRARIGEIDVVITSADASKQQLENPGSVHIIDKLLVVACGIGSLRVKSLKPAGKKEMSAEAFIAGYGRHLMSA